jgi:hypothetical protein
VLFPDGENSPGVAIKIDQTLYGADGAEALPNLTVLCSIYDKLSKPDKVAPCQCRAAHKDNPGHRDEPQFRQSATISEREPISPPPVTNHWLDTTLSASQGARGHAD